MSDTRVIQVDTPSRSYEVFVGQGILGEVGPRAARLIRGRRAHVISDSNVAPLYADDVTGSLRRAGFTTDVQVFEAGEASKDIHTLSALLEGLAAAELTRDDVVVAVGGGVTGDIAGLAAALYLRGCAVIQVPTSLLAMVDSSVGGKCAIDLAAGKNLAGAFFQPTLVIADVECLDTLTHEQLTDSCGEMIKHGVIRDATLFRKLAEQPLNADGARHAMRAALIARNVEIKRDVVDADEREGGVRQILNFGHTIGHAIEAASDFTLGHGSSVAAGMCCMARAAVACGWCPQDVADDIERVVDAYGLPTDTRLSPGRIMSLVLHDKKRHGDSFNVVVPRAIGVVEIRTVSAQELADLVDLGCGVSR